MIKHGLLSMVLGSCLYGQAMGTFHTIGSKATDLLTYPGSALMHLGQCIYINELCNRIFPTQVCNASERHQQAALGCATIIVTGYTLTRIGAYYYALKTGQPYELGGSAITIKPESIMSKCKQLQDDIKYNTKPLVDLEHDRILLLQEIMPDIQLSGRSETEIHKRLMDRLRSGHIGIMLAIGDINQALLELKNPHRSEPDEQDLDEKGYVL